MRLITSCHKRPSCEVKRHHHFPNKADFMASDFLMPQNLGSPFADCPSLQDGVVSPAVTQPYKVSHVSFNPILKREWWLTARTPMPTFNELQPWLCDRGMEEPATIPNKDQY
ncbi:hypothetical protein AMTR_s00060p00198270 [Amborella trichopoda]|uniref:Uncharacterized protein n=1 Tax=Amborella trichopoda TaxID=13333 RepID=W1NL16_AMBTC|nr:hypothetical protein AMTR_s00060p00198270 [Amborella trichopoda]